MLFCHSFYEKILKTRWNEWFIYIEDTCTIEQWSGRRENKIVGKNKDKIPFGYIPVDNQLFSGIQKRKQAKLSLWGSGSKIMR